MTGPSGWARWERGFSSMTVLSANSSATAINLRNLESLAENRVIALIEDSEGNVWAGLHASPPNSFSSVRPAFQSLKPVSTHPNSFGETLVNAIYEDSRGAVWMGAGGALNRLDRKTGESQDA